jgi:hypothetical protein
VANKVIFTGCSFTAGTGWHPDPAQSYTVDYKEASELWVNLCHQQLPTLQGLDLINLGLGGASNSNIFESTVDAMAVHGGSIKFLFCQWTSYPRYHWNLGFELWSTKDNVTNWGTLAFDINTSVGINHSAKDLSRFKKQYLMLHHPHWEIVKILRYTHTLSHLAQLHNIKIFFINGLCHWDQDFFEYQHTSDTKPEDYTTYTKKEILQIDFRNDIDIHKLYNLAHSHYKLAGGINSDQWINLYGSMENTKIDTNYDHYHPGKLSNLKYFTQIKTAIESHIQHSV